MSLLTIKNSLFAFGACISGFLVNLLGGWTASLETLLILMVIDYISGLIVAAVFKKSPKTPEGNAKSSVAQKGIFKKGGMLLLVLVAVRLDIALSLKGATRTAVIFFLTANEGISIIENIGLMGVPLPSVLTNALAVLMEKSNSTSDKLSKRLNKSRTKK